MFREHIAAHGGRVIDTAGDSVQAVFDTAAGAVTAALAAQRELARKTVAGRERRGWATDFQPLAFDDYFQPSGIETRQTLIDP